MTDEERKALEDLSRGVGGNLPADNLVMVKLEVADLARWEVDAGWTITRDGLESLRPAAPLAMILFCPDCSLQHIDKPLSCSLGVGCDETGVCFAGAQGRPDQCSRWTNPPHRSHLCAGCGHIWRPADVPTAGVAEITTQGKADHQPPIRKRSGRCIGGCDGPVDMEP